MARYDAYLLRIWRSTRDDRRAWRCQVEHLPSGERLHFTELRALLAYLQTQSEANDPPAPDPLPRE